MKIKTLALAATSLLALSACDDTTNTLGTSIIDGKDLLNISADTFGITTQSVTANSILARNSIGYLGQVVDPETGDEITGNYTVKFHTLSDFSIYNDTTFTTIDSVSQGKSVKTTYTFTMVRDAQGKVFADSCSLDVYYKGFYGDSTALMKLTAYELSTPLSESALYMSDFDPETAGMVRTNGLKITKSYTLLDLSLSDKARQSSNYSPHVHIPLNQTYTDKSNISYNNIGTYVLYQYQKNPNWFHQDYRFAKNVLPGFYMKHQSGTGSMMNVLSTYLYIYYHMKVHKQVVNEIHPALSSASDYTYNAVASFASTDEVTQHTKITNSTNTIKQLVADQSCTYLKTPAGIFTEITLPVEAIMQGHEKDSLSTAKIVLPRLNNQVHSKFAFGTPKTLLLVPKDSLENFFKNNQVPNYITSYTASFNSSDNSYTFNNVSGLIKAMHKCTNKNTNPQWNKAIVVPITLTTTTSSGTTTVIKAVNDMSLTNTRLVGGKQNTNTPLTISIIYSKFKQ